MWRAKWHNFWEQDDHGWRQDVTWQGAEGPKVEQTLPAPADRLQMEQTLPEPADRLARLERNVSDIRRMVDELLRVHPAARQAGSSSAASSSADSRLAQVEQDVWGLRRMIGELVTAQPAAQIVTAAAGRVGAPTHDWEARNCYHGAPYLFTTRLNQSIENGLVFVEAEGDTEKLESALYRARDSERFCIPGAPMALEVIEKWGVGWFGVEIHKGGANSYLRFGCRGCNRATAQLFEQEKFKVIFDDVFKIDSAYATY
jgi:hypothetical protein